MSSAPARYDSTAAAAAFAAFSAQAGGEKALIWAHARRAIAAHAHDAGVRVLDFGCGTGWLARQAAAEFAARATGYDPSATMIAEAQAQPSAARFTNDLQALNDAAPFDLAFMVFVTPAIGDAKSLRTLFTQSASLLRDGARLFAIAANPEAVFGRHAFFQCRKPEKLKAGAAYETDILAPDGGVIVTVQDYHWPVSAVVKAAERAGLTLAADARLADPASGQDPKHFPYRVYEFARAAR